MASGDVVDTSPMSTAPRKRPKAASVPPFAKILRRHLGCDPASIAIVGDSFPLRAIGDLQLAVDDWLRVPGRRREMVGVVTDRHVVRLGALASPPPSERKHGWAADVGPVEYSAVPLADGGSLASVERGLLLLSDGDARLAVLVAGPCGEPYIRQVRVEVGASTQPESEQLLQQLRDGMRRRSIFRGRSLSIGADRQGEMEVRFQALPKVAREDVILPPGVLERIERNTVRFTHHAEALHAMGRHLKRGLLLYGPPGTGKTFSAMFLASQMPDRTVLMVTGRAVGLIEQVAVMARQLAPATVVFEDVDLIAEDRRTTQNACATPVMFELLNAMDGLAEDADVLFVLTTNRPEVLEPALAARPGRVDQAIEIPLPDEDCRDRLIGRYGEGMRLALTDRAAVIARTQGTSAAFIKELLRRAALIAADASPGATSPEVDDSHVRDAMQEMLVDGGSMTRTLLGVAGAGA